MSNRPTQALRTLTMILAVALGLCAASQAHAALLFYDGFNYGSTGQALTSATSTWAGSSVIQYQSAGLTYPGLSTTGGNIAGSSAWNNGSAQSVAVTFSSPLDIHTYSEIWLSVLVAMTPNSSSVGDKAFSVGMHIKPNSWQATTALYFTKAWGSGNSTTPAPYTLNGTSMGTGISENTVLLVMRVPNNGNISGWVNPALDTIPTNGIAGSTHLDAFNSGLLDVAFSATAMAIRVDELRIGTTFADVVVPVPEPASLALLLGGSMLIAVRRRQH